MCVHVCVTSHVTVSPTWTQYALNKFTAYLDQRQTTATLICDVAGYPEVTYVWSFNGGTDPSWIITETDGKSLLTIPTLTSANLGTYQCKTSNAEGSEEFDLHLLEPGEVHC